jgi:hypothetical protein
MIISMIPLSPILIPFVLLKIKISLSYFLKISIPIRVYSTFNLAISISGGLYTMVVYYFSSPFSYNNIQFGINVFFVYLPSVYPMKNHKFDNMNLNNMFINYVFKRKFMQLLLLIKKFRHLLNIEQ